MLGWRALLDQRCREVLTELDDDAAIRRAVDPPRLCLMIRVGGTPIDRPRAREDRRVVSRSKRPCAARDLLGPARRVGSVAARCAVRKRRRGSMRALCNGTDPRPSPRAAQVDDGTRSRVRAAMARKGHVYLAEVVAPCLVAGAAESPVLCAKPRRDGTFNASLKIRESCTPKEQLLNLAAVGLQAAPPSRSRSSTLHGTEEGAR